MNRKLAALAVTAACLTVVAAPAAVASPLVTYKWENTGFDGGPWYVKDNGAGAAYTLTENAAVASNFTRLYGKSVGGVGFYVYEDGNGRCIEDSDDSSNDAEMIAATCSNLPSQHLSDPSPVTDLGAFSNGQSCLMANISGFELAMEPPGLFGQTWRLS
jgi:hypothetical protein